MKVMYPGSFDPITNGHLDIIKRCSKKFDKVVVTVLKNSLKKTMFTCEERVKIIEEATAEFGNVEVDTFSGLLVDYARQNDIGMVVKGLRALSDFEYEFQMALMNNRLDNEIETFFLMTSNRHSFISSSIVKEVFKFGGEISEFVPENVKREMEKKAKEA